ncbi:hypothetical protein Pyn_28080 [Prunus yedoensis var. nudiflora]|uniref:Uncharacterized protein n=1 Tax=Prunus yedoensis var. nudiflora TaxID=2094558 RepID=A0A314UHV3_PRUYE|nr:hypothetical protein Pyn_28080 [Prunus yedoensis var. nudiflora]
MAVVTTSGPWPSHSSEGSRWSFLCSFYKFSMEIWSNGMMEETSVVHHLYVWMRKAWIRST